jgi:hypothetical protein
MLWDLGPFRGKLPQATVLTDRADGKLWHLSHSNTPHLIPDPNHPGQFIDDGFGYITISDVIPTTPDKIVYGPNDGPVLAGNPRLRLFVRGGYLGVEELETLPRPTTDQDQARILTRRGVNKETKELVVQAGRKPSEPIAFRPISFDKPQGDL